MWAITNEEKTLFLTLDFGQKKYSWTDNIALAYVFQTEQEAAEYEESPKVDHFLNFESDVINYINDVFELYEAEQERINERMREKYGLKSSNQ